MFCSRGITPRISQAPPGESKPLSGVSPSWRWLYLVGLFWIFPLDRFGDCDKNSSCADCTNSELLTAGFNWDTQFSVGGTCGGGDNDLDYPVNELYCYFDQSGMFLIQGLHIKEGVESKNILLKYFVCTLKYVLSHPKHQKCVVGVFPLAYLALAII